MGHITKIPTVWVSNKYLEIAHDIFLFVSQFVFVWFAESVKDLIRFLKRETETGDVRQELGKTQTLQKDLIPLVKQFHKDKVLFDAVIRY